MSRKVTVQLSLAFVLVVGALLVWQADTRVAPKHNPPLDPTARERAGGDPIRSTETDDSSSPYAPSLAKLSAKIASEQHIQKSLPKLSVRKPAGIFQKTYYASDIEDSADIPTLVAQVIGDEDGGAAQRFAALSALRRLVIDPILQDQILQYLSDTERFAGMSELSFQVYINELVALFHDRTPIYEPYIDVSIEVVQNEAETEVIRDYVLQGLSRAYPQASPSQRAKLRAQFIDLAASGDGTSLKGTALLALNRVAGQEQSAAVDSWIQGEIQAILNDRASSERTLVTAIGIVAQRGWMEFEKQLIEIAQSATQEADRGFSDPVILSALSALKSFETAEIDALHTERIAASPESLLGTFIESQRNFSE